jgi:TDG/mug DNA glycosylase family protein
MRPINPQCANNTDYLMAKENPIQGLPDILAKGLGVVFCGINPGMRSAALGHHFAGRNNRFWQVLHLSGVTPQQVLPEDARSLLSYGCGLTSAVERPTVCASDLKRTDFIDARPELERKIRRYAPRTIAFLGKPACSAIFSQRELPWGQQVLTFAGAGVWVLPNPSGLNCAFTLASLTAAYRELWKTVGSATDDMLGFDSWSSSQRFRSIPPP